MNEWKEESLSTVSSIISDVTSSLPTVLSAIMILILGWILSRIIRFVLKRILRVTKFHKISDKLNEAKLFGDGFSRINLEKVLLTFVKWVVLLISVIAAADIAQLTVISTEIANLLRYLPVLFSALVIFVIGLYAANLIKQMLLKVFKSMRLGGSKIVSTIVFYVIIIFATITALNHAGIDTQIITNNFTLVFGAVLLAFALAFGLGSREVMSDLLKTFYARKSYSVGDKIKIGETVGIIQSIDGISITLKTESGQLLIIPIREMVENRIELK